MHCPVTLCAQLIESGKLAEWGKHKGHFYGTRRIQPGEEASNGRLGRSATFKVQRSAGRFAEKGGGAEAALAEGWGPLLLRPQRPLALVDCS